LGPYSPLFASVPPADASVSVVGVFVLGLERLGDPLRGLVLLLAVLVDLLLELRGVALAAFLLALLWCRPVRLDTRSLSFESRGCGGTGRRAGFRTRWAVPLEVRVLSPASLRNHAASDRGRC
jgi:hypothetical protein